MSSEFDNFLSHPAIRQTNDELRLKHITLFSGVNKYILGCVEEGLLTLLSDYFPVLAPVNFEVWLRP